MDLPVITVAIYLNRRDSPLPVSYEVDVNEVVLNRFEYQVVRLWEYVDEILAGKWPELSPLLAMLVERPDEEVLGRERELILREQDEKKRADLLACAVTIGARYFDKEFLWRFFREEVEMMREASFIDDWLQEKWEEGMLKGFQQGFQDGRRSSSQKILLRVLRRRFGTLSRDVVAALQDLTAEQLEELVDVALTVPNKDSFAEEVKKWTMETSQMPA